MTPLPDGSGVTTGTLGPQDTTRLVVRVELPAHVLEPAAERAAHRRHAAHGRPNGRAARAARRPTRLNLPGIPSNAQVPEHAADVPDRRLSAARIAAEHGDRLQHERDADRRHAHVAEGTAHASRWAPTCGGSGSTSSSRRRRPGRSPSATCSPTCPGVANTGTPFASFLLGQVQQFSIDLQQDADPEPRALPGVLHPGRLAAVAIASRSMPACATR